MKIYRGFRDRDYVAHVTVQSGKHSKRPLPSRLGLANHSPTGLEWGYSGSGPAQLALALLADVLHDNERALRLHQRFKFKVVTVLPREGWALTEDEVRATADMLEVEAKEREPV